MIGRTISHYRITAELGRGGMGVVYAADDDRLERTVAIKVLPPHVASDPGAKERFIQEARAASSLEHPNICTIYDIGETDQGEVFLVMPLYVGRTLQDEMTSGPMPVISAAGIVRQIALGLSRAHAAGMVHRDIKPANIMVLEDGLVKILDFGVAKLEEGLDLTTDGSTVGTAAYMSPEQARGEDVDARSDLWSVGVILYECLSGRRPFPGGYDQAVIYGILNSDVEPLTDAPESLASIAHRLLSKNPADRFETANEVAEALHPFTAESGKFAAVPSAPTGRFSTRFVIGLVGVAVAVTLGVILLMGRSDGPTITPDPALAVLPFQVQGAPELDYLSKGMPTLLSASINGMGDLRAVDPLSVSSVLGDDEVGINAAIRVAKRFTAEGVVVGSVIQLGDEIQLRATVYDPDGRDINSAQSSASSQAELPRAVDDLARGLIAGRFEGRGSTTASLSAITSHNFQALRFYMDGESLAREGKWPQAYEALARAVDEDSTFAMAWYRMASLGGWPGVSSQNDVDIMSATRHMAGLPVRVRKLIEAQRAVTFDSTWTAISRFDDYTKRYPDDAHAWFRLGDLQLHNNRHIGRGDREALVPLGRALEYDPGAFEAAQHLFDYAIKDRDWGRFDSLLAVTDVEDLWDPSMLEAFRVHESDPPAFLSAVSKLAQESEDPNSVWERALGLGRIARTPDLYLPSIASFVEQGGSINWLLFTVPVFALAGRLGDVDARLDLFLSKANAPAGESLHWLKSAVPLTYAPESTGWGSAMPPDDVPIIAQNHLAYAWGVAAWQTGEGGILEQALDSLRAAKTAASDHQAMDLEVLKLYRLGDYSGALALLDPELSMLQFEQPPDGIDYTGGFFSNDFTTVRRWLSAELLFEAKRYDEARAWYRTLHQLDSFVPTTAYYYAAPAHRRLGEIAEIEGDDNEAIRQYEKFVGYWHAADPELQPMVTEARARLDALLRARAVAQ